MQIFLETERLLLRRVTLEDAPLLHALDSDPQVIRYTDLGGCPSLTARQEMILPRWLAYYETLEKRGFWKKKPRETAFLAGSTSDLPTPIPEKPSLGIGFSNPPGAKGTRQRWLASLSGVGLKSGA